MGQEDRTGQGMGMPSSDSGYYELMLNMLHFIYEDKNLSDRIGHILEMVGIFLHASRIYVFEDGFEHGFEHGVSANTYEWCDSGVEPRQGALQAVPHALTREWYAMLRAQGVILADSATLLPEGISAMFGDQKICSRVMLPLCEEETPFGFIGFDDCREHRRWSRQEIELLHALATLITTLLSRHRMETLLKASHRRFRTVMDNIEIPIYVTDLETSKILFANKKFIETVKNEKAEGKLCWEVLKRHPDGQCPDCPRNHLRFMPEGASYSWEVRSQGAEKWYYCTDSLIEWVDGRRAHLQSAVEITQRKEYEEKLMVSASCDAMTGIHNRESGLRLVSELIAVGKREHYISTFCYLDLDNLKHVNDTFGHAEGDRLILTLVRILSGIVRSNDIFARIGGDEFVLALRSCSLQNARRVIANAQRKLDQFNRLGQLPYPISFSVGFAEISPTESCRVDELLMRADKDMYANKQSKKDEGVRYAHVWTESGMSAEVRAAINHGSLT